MLRFSRRHLVALVLALCLLVPVAAGPAASAKPLHGAQASRFYDRDCADFATQRQAQRFFRRHNPRRDPHRLDGDDDGIACEDLP